MEGKILIAKKPLLKNCHSLVTIVPHCQGLSTPLPKNLVQQGISENSVRCISAVPFPYFLQEAKICAFVVSWLLSFITCCHNSRFMLLILLFLLEKVLLLDIRWSSSLWGASSKQKKNKNKTDAVSLTVFFLNNRKRSSKLAPIYADCANLKTCSSQRCCCLRHAILHLKGFVCLFQITKRRLGRYCHLCKQKQASYTLKNFTTL